MTTPPRILGTAPVTPYDRRWEERADALEFEALARIRSVAERWAGSVAVVTSAFGIAGLVGGRDALSDLREGYDAAAGVFFATALLAALAAILLAALAAQGTPKRARAPGGAAVREWYRASAGRAATQLVTSRVAAVAAVLLLAAGIGITWYGPTSPSSSAAVVVVTRSGAIACGDLRPSARSTLSVGTATFEVSDVVSVVPVAVCPR